MSEPEHLELFEIKITRVIQPSGEQGFTLTTPEQFSFIEVLGLLEGSKWQLYQQMTQRYGG